MMNRFSSRASSSLAASRAARGASLLVLATLAATSQLLGGCTGDLVIVDPSGDGGGHGVTSGAPSAATTSTSTAMSSATTTGTTGGGGAGGGPGGSSNIAIFNEQLSSNNKAAWLSEGEKLDYVTLIIGISFGRGAQSCNDPLFDLSSDRSYHQLIFGLSLSVQKVGKYNLASTDVIAAYQYWSTDGTGNGGGEAHPLTEGTIEVLSLDGKTFKVRVAQLPGDLNGLNGDYAGTRCPPLE